MPTRFLTRLRQLFHTNPRPTPHARTVLRLEPLGERIVPVAGFSTAPETIVNQLTLGDQTLPQIAADAAGNYVIVYSGQSQPYSSHDIWARLYSASGTPLGNEFRVNTHLPGEQFAGGVAMTSDGGFVVVWNSEGQDGSTWGVYARKFDAAGVPIGGEFRVDHPTPWIQREATVAATLDGGFIVAWAGDGIYEQGLYTSDVGARLYDANGIALSDVLLVNQSTVGQQTRPTIVMGADGAFIVVWDSQGQDQQEGGIEDEYGWGVYTRQFAADGTPTGDEFLINQTTNESQWFNSAARTPDGGLVIAWQGPAQDGDITEVFVRRYSADLVPLGDEARVNSYTLHAQLYPEVAVNSAGQFLISWMSQLQDGGDGINGTGWGGIYAQLYDSDGNPLGGELQGNVYTYGFQGVIGVVPVGIDFRLVWKSEFQDGDLSAVVTRQFVLDAVAPTVTISPPSITSTTGKPVSFTVTFADENLDQINLTAAQVQVIGSRTTLKATVTITGTGNTRTITLSEIRGGVGTLRIVLPAGIATDVAGNLSAGPVESATVKVTGKRAIAVTTVSPPGALAPGKTYSFRVGYRNTGTQAADSAYILVKLPPYASFNGASTPGWERLGGGWFRMNLGVVPAGKSGNVRLALTISPAAPHGARLFLLTAIIDSLTQVASAYQTPVVIR